MRRYASGVMLVLFATCLAASAFAAEDQPTHNDLVEMNATLKEIARSLKQQADTQKADLLLKRVTLATTQLANAQERLNRIDLDIRALENERGEFETLLAAKSATAPRDGVKSHLQGVQERLNALRQERGSVQNDIEALRREARDWQTLLDKTITGGS